MKKAFICGLFTSLIFSFQTAIANIPIDNNMMSQQDKELHRLDGLHSMLSKCDKAQDRSAIIRFYLSYFPKQKDAVRTKLGGIFANEFELATAKKPKKDFCGTLDAITFSAYLDLIPEDQSLAIKAGMKEGLLSFDQPPRETTHFRFHYSLSGENVVSQEWIDSLATDSNAGYAEFTWNKQVTEWGYREPNNTLFSDKIEVYVTTESGSTHFWPPDGSIVINPEDVLYQQSDSSHLLVCFSHEFHHACEHAYIPINSPFIKQMWVIEGSARWMQHETMRAHPNFNSGEPRGMYSWEETMYNTLVVSSLDLKTKDPDGYESVYFWYFIANNLHYDFSGIGIRRNINRMIWEELNWSYLNGLSWLDTNAAIERALSHGPPGVNTFRGCYETLALSYSVPYPSGPQFLGEDWFDGDLSYMQDWIPTNNTLHRDDIVDFPFLLQSGNPIPNTADELQGISFTNIILLADRREKIKITFDGDDSKQFFVWMIVGNDGEHNGSFIDPDDSYIEYTWFQLASPSNIGTIDNILLDPAVGRDGLVIVVGKTDDGIAQYSLTLDYATGYIPPPETISYPTSSGTGQYIVSWSSSTGATSYQLEKSNNGGSSWSQIYSGLNTSYPENVSNGNYRYRVKVTKGANSSEWTTGDWDCIVNTSQQPPPTPASISYPTSSSTGEYTVSWSSSSGAESYQLERSSNGGGSWLQVYYGSSTSRPESVSNGNYRYRVKAINSGGSSGWRTGTWDCVVNIPPQGPPPPAFISYPSFSDTGLYTVSWGASSGADQYEVQRICGDWGCQWGHLDYYPNTSFQEDTGSGVFRYRVRAFASGVPGNWRTGDHDCVVPPPPTTPAFINYPSDSNTGSYIISWGSSDWVKSYQLERSNNGGISWLQIYSGSSISYSENVGNGSYRYRVKATNFKGESGYKTGTWDCVVNITQIPPPKPSVPVAGSLFVWGQNDHGQCSNVPTGNNFISVAAGWYHSVALKEDGSLVAWGENQDGQCNVPEGNDFVAVSAGERFSIALKSNGSIVAWGSNAFGQRNIPAPNNNFIAIAAGWIHCLALKSDGSLVAWGDNGWDRCICPPGTGFKAIAAGYAHSLALKSDGSLVAWGAGKAGQSGWPHFGQSVVPAGNNFMSIAAGGNHNLALKSDGSIVVWGNYGGGLYSVPPGNDFKAISAGWYHNLALKSDGSVIAWGENWGGCDGCSPIGKNFVAIAVGSTHNTTIFSVAGDYDGDNKVSIEDLSLWVEDWLQSSSVADTDPAPNGDDYIDFYDLSALCAEWLETGTDLQADLNRDGIVDFSDFAILSDGWHQTCSYLDTDLNKDGWVDFRDFASLVQHWLEDGRPSL